MNRIWWQEPSTFGSGQHETHRQIETEIFENEVERLSINEVEEFRTKMDHVTYLNRLIGKIMSRDY